MLLFFIKLCKIITGGIKMERKNNLEKQKLLEVINNFKINQNCLEVNIMFTNSNFDRKEKYKLYNLLTDEKDILPTIENSLRYLRDEVIKRSFEKYDLELSMDETVQVVEKDKVINGIDLLLKMEECIIDDSKVVDKGTNLNTLSFIIMHLYDSKNKKSVYFFEKYVHATSKYKTTSKFTLHGKKAVPFKDEILTINPIVDAILCDDNYYILNRKNFNSIFNFKDVFYKIINENQEDIKKSKLFIESDRFIKDCMEDGRYLPRLTKVILARGFETVNSNKDKLPELKAQYKLSFQLTKDGRIKYNDKKEISDIINVLLDHFVISALTDKKMLAKAIEKYEV
jgi:hypothetical protein